MTRSISARLVPTLLIVVSMLLALYAMPNARAADMPSPLPVTHEHFNGFEGPVTQNGDGTAGESTYKNASGPICSIATFDANSNTDCEGNFAHNETSIAVNPSNAKNMLGGANDYQLRLTAGGSINETIFTRAHVTFDGGATWTTYPIDYSNYAATGDPGAAFDGAGNAYMATLGFRWSQGNGCCTNPDVLVAHSSDGGATWSTPARVASGSGSDGSVGVFNDKEYIAAWGKGNAIVTWTVFNDGNGGSYINSPIYDSVTHDGGKTWSTPTQISGSAPFCVGASGNTACDQDQGSVPVVAADGSIYVSFFSTANVTNFRDQVLVVKVDPASGARIGGPYKVGGVYDGVTDYPINADGRQTYQDSQFRTWAFGNLTTDPTNAQHLAMVWSDMRDSTLPAPSDPYSAKTNSDVIVSQSFNGGATWSAPAALKIKNDQFMPWSAYDSSGRLRVGYFDRSYDAANHKYGYTLASETSPGTLKFSFAQVTDALSDPTQGDRWFSGTTVNPAFPHPTSFLGDYSNIAATPSGVVSYWTDLRNSTCFTVRCGSSEDAYVAANQ